MTPMIIKIKSKSETCNVSTAGVGMTNDVVNRIGWKVDDMICIGFIEEVKCLLFRPVDENERKDEIGFKFTYANNKNKSGGRINCMSFMKNYLQTLVALPKNNIPPIFITKNFKWTFALLLEDLRWEEREFSNAEASSIAEGSIGIYEFLGQGNAILRIGEGNIKDRINTYLMHHEFQPDIVKKFRYIALNDTADGKILEKILIAKYETETGVLPRLQKVRS